MSKPEDLEIDNNDPTVIGSVLMGFQCESFLYFWLKILLLIFRAVRSGTLDCEGFEVPVLGMIVALTDDELIDGTKSMTVCKAKVIPTYDQADDGDYLQRGEVKVIRAGGIGWLEDFELPEAFKKQVSRVWKWGMVVKARSYRGKNGPNHLVKGVIRMYYRYPHDHDSSDLDSDAERDNFWRSLGMEKKKAK